MKSTKVLVKRSQSPSQPLKTIQISDRKKKSASNMHLQSSHNQPKKGLKQFDTYGKTEKKRNNYLKQLLKSNNQQTNKYRIVTEPVEQKLLYLGNSNFGNANSTNGNAMIKIPIHSTNASAVIKIPSNSRSKLQSHQHNHNHHHQYTQKYLKLNIRTSQNSKQKLKTGESFHNKQPQRQQCRNCERYREQLQHYKKELNKICMDKILWKSGQLHIDDVKESFFNLSNKRKLKTLENDFRGNSSSNYYYDTKGNINNNNSQQKHYHKTTTNSIQKQNRYGIMQHGNNIKITQLNDNYIIKYRSPSQTHNYQQQQKPLPTTKVIERQLAEIKKHVLDLMNDVQSLSGIDYPKMLSLNVKIFKQDPFYVQSPSTQEQQLKQLLSQLRTSMQGRVTDQDLVDVFSNNEMNEHNKMIFRNLKNRLNHYLRQNVQLKIKKEVLQRSQEITKQSEDYLRRVIEDVLLTYADSIGDQ